MSSLWERLAGWFSQKEEETHLDKMEQFGVDLVTDGKMAVRITTIREDLHKLVDRIQNPKGDTPEERLLDLRNNIIELDRILHEVAIPFTRAGTDPRYGVIVNCWAKINAQTLGLIPYLLYLMRRKGEGIRNERVRTALKEELLRKFQFLINTHYLNVVEQLISISWRGEDVAPSRVTMIQSPMMVMGGGGGVTPTSGGRISEMPKGGPYPPMMSSRIGEEEE